MLLTWCHPVVGSLLEPELLLAFLSSFLKAVCNRGQIRRSRKGKAKLLGTVEEEASQK